MHVRWRICLALLAGAATFIGACHEPTAPKSTSHAGPDFSRSYYVPVWCRMWPDGSVTHAAGGGAWDNNGCHVTITATPSYVMGSAQPNPITYQFSPPVIDVEGWAVSFYTWTPCPTTPQTYAVYAPGAMTPTEQDVFDQSCSNGYLYGSAWFPAYLGPVTKAVITPPSPMPPDNPTYLPPGTSLEFYVGFNMPCPTTTDTILNNNRSLRETLNEQWNTSKTEQLERAGWIYRDDATGQYSVVPDLVDRRDRCGVDIPTLPPLMAGKTLVRAWHTHIIRPGELLGPNCMGAGPGQRALNGPYGFLGDAADTDLGWVRKSGYGHILIDDDQLFAIFSDGGWQGYDWIENCRWAGA